jgi:hypothetical protein
VSFCNGKEKSDAGRPSNRWLCCKRIAEGGALKALPQDLDLAALRSMQQHNVAFHETVIEEFFGMLAWDIRYKARPFENLFERRTLAAGHLNGWHGHLNADEFG